MTSRPVMGPPDAADDARVGAAVVPLPVPLQAGSGGGGGGGSPRIVDRCAYCGGGFEGRPGHAASCRRCWWRGGVVQPADMDGADPTRARVLIDDSRDLAYIDLVATLAIEAQGAATSRRTITSLRTDRAVAEHAARKALVSSAWGWWAALVGALGSVGGALLQSSVTDLQLGGGMLWCLAASVLASGLWGVPWWALRAGASTRRAP